jgi:hypothetical protein
MLDYPLPARSADLPAFAPSALSAATGPSDFLGYQLDPEYEKLSDEDKAFVDKQQFQQRHGGMGAASLGDFQTLLSRLEASKIRQQQAKDISARPGIYAEGLGRMMSNF